MTPSFWCRLPTLTSSSISATPQNKRFTNPLVCRSAVTRKPLWTPVIRSSPSSPRRPSQSQRITPSGAASRKNDAASSKWKRTVGTALTPSVALAATLGGLLGSDSLKQCLESLAEGGGNNNDGSLGGNGGDGGGGNGGQEICRLAVTEDDDDNNDQEEGEEEDGEGEEEDDDDFEEGEIEEYYEDDLDEEDYVDPTAPFECNNVDAIGLPEGEGVPRKKDLFAGINCQPGYRCTQEELRKDLKTLSHTEGVEHVEIRVTPVKGTKGKKCDVNFVFKSVSFPRMKQFKVKGASAIPPEVVEQVMEKYDREMERGGTVETNMQTLGMIRDTVEKW